MVMRSPSNTRTHHWLSSPFAINQIKSTSKRCQRPDALKHPIAHCKDGYGNWMRPSGSSPSGSPTETTTQDDAHPISTAGRLADNSRVIQARSLNWRKQSSSISKRFDSPKELVGETLSSRCKRQEDSEPRAVAKLSHLLAIQTIRTMGPVSANSGESESSHPPW